MTTSEHSRPRYRPDRVDSERQTRAVGGGATEADLIKWSLTDPEAFAVLFNRHHEAIRRFAATRAGPEAASDLAAEVFCIAFDQRHTFDPTYPSAKPWLLGIAANLARQHHRRAAVRDRARTRKGARTRGQAAATDPQEQVAAGQLGESVARALERLPARDRDPLLRHVWTGATYRNIARDLDLPVGTVRSRIHRARRRLQRELAGTSPGPIGGSGDVPPAQPA